MFNKKLAALAVGLIGSIAAVPAHAVPTFADVSVLMDESGSMSGEQSWIAAQIPVLETGLVGAGLAPNQYNLIGFGASAGGSPSDLRGFPAGNPVPVNNSPGTYGTSAQFVTAAAGLVANGGTEDGWAAINLANSLAGRAGAARNYILITDEDRDDTNAALTYASTLASLTSANILLNAIVDATFRCSVGDATTVIGISAGGACYVADGLGGYTTGSGGAAVSGAGSTIADYVDLAIASGGAAWNLNLLRAGGLTADSFSKAFIDIKVEEITNQTPEPGSLALAGLAMTGLFGLRRRAKKA